jgi:hypothetical protein
VQQLIDLLGIYYVDTCYDDCDGGDGCCDRDNADDNYGGGCGFGNFAIGSVIVSVVMMVTITVLVILVKRK